MEWTYQGSQNSWEALSRLFSMLCYISPKGRVDPRHSGIAKKVLSQQASEWLLCQTDPTIWKHLDKYAVVSTWRVLIRKINFFICYAESLGEPKPMPYWNCVASVLYLGCISSAFPTWAWPWQTWLVQDWKRHFQECLSHVLAAHVLGRKELGTTAWCSSFQWAVLEHLQ